MIGLFQRQVSTCVFREARWYTGLGGPESAMLPEQFEYLLILLGYSELKLFKFI